MGDEIVLEWDERKRWANLGKHGLDFADCVEVFSGPVQRMVDSRFDYGEVRFQTYGLLRGRVVLVIHTEDDGVVRVISMRKANQHEQENYFKSTVQD